MFVWGKGDERPVFKNSKFWFITITKEWCSASSVLPPRDHGWKGQSISTCSFSKASIKIMFFFIPTYLLEVPQSAQRKRILIIISSELGGWFNHTFGRKFPGLLFLALQFHLCFLWDWRSRRMHLRLEGGEESSISSIFPPFVRLLWDHLGVPHLCDNCQHQEASLPPTCGIIQCSLVGKCGNRQCKFLRPVVSGFFHVSFLGKETRISLSARQS